MLPPNKSLNQTVLTARLVSFALYSMKKYRTILADPPWKYGKWGKASDTPLARKKFPNGQWKQCFDLPYPTMTVQEIAALSVADLAADDCDLYLWTTQKYLPDAFSVMQVWGFRYCQALTWCKAPRGIGQGGLFCPTTEFLLLGRKGRMPKGKRRLDSTWWQVTRTSRHSQKPDLFYEIIETVSDDPRLEMFSRRKRDGWDVWGDEIESDESITRRLTGRQKDAACYAHVRHFEVYK